MLEGFKEFMENELRLSENSINSYYSDVNFLFIVFGDVLLFNKYCLYILTSA